MKKIWPFLLLLVPLALALVLPRFVGRDSGPAPVVQCPDPVRGCVLSLDGKRVEVGFSTSPVVLKPFELRVAAPEADQVSADFTMQGMDMGSNRYVLQRATDGVWQGRVVLPVCVSGTSNWTLTLELDGKRRQIPFAATKN
jgi:hypothetical protein